MLLCNKTEDEIEAFGFSQETWGNPFLLIWRTSAGKTSVSSTVWIFLCALFMLRPWDVARPSVEMVSRFLGFSLRNLVSRRCRRFGWRSKASGRMCAASARSFWIVVLWKSGIPDVENGETINNGVIWPVNMESLDSINNQGWFWDNSGFDHGLYYRGFLEVNWLTAGEIPCRTEESKRGSVFVILQGWWDKLAQGELLWQMLLHNICHVCPNMGVWQRYVPPALHCHGQGLFHKIALTLRWECSDWQLWQEPGSQHWAL